MTRFFLLCLFCVGCGGTTLYQPGGSLRFDPQPDVEIDDQDIAQAFGARPQMTTPLRVAYYSFDPERNEEIESALSEIPGIADVYAIPRLMVTGQRRYEGAVPARQLSVKRLRLLAARARCDVLLVVDHGYKIERRPNGLVALNILIIPAFFTPFMDAEVESYLETHIIDTRNGYVYGQIESEQEGETGRMNIYSRADRELADEHWGRLLTETSETLAQVINAR